MLSGEIFYLTRLLSQYMKALSNSDKLRAFIALNMIYLIPLFENNGKSAVYTGGDINGIYLYLEMIGYPTTFTTSGQCYHYFSPSSSINNDTGNLQPVIEALHTIKKSICEFCGIIGHKYNVCIIRGTKPLPPSLRRNMNQFNVLHGDEPNELPR